MTRQPFLPRHSGEPTSVGFDEVKRNPQLACLIGVCASGWSHVDLQLSLAMGAMLGVENPASVAVFSAMRNARAQRDSLQAAARATLSGEILEIFDAIMIVHKALDSQRNDVVHGIWGHSSAFPDAAIWESMQSHANMLIEAYHKELEGGWKSGKEHSQHIAKGYYIYSYADLSVLISDIERLIDSIRNFHAYLRYKGKPAGEHALHALNSEPLLQRTRAGMKNSVGER